MVARLSAGLLVYRRQGEEGLELFLAHPGGPYFLKRDLGVWTVPKGEYEPAEGPLAAAEREFEEETGLPAPAGRRLELGEVRQAGGKRVRVYAVEGELDCEQARSNLFELEWPPGSGRVELFPEVDRLAWFPPSEARRRLNPSQAELVGRLLAAIEAPAG